MLGAGGRADVQLLGFLASVPIGFSVGVAFEQHSAARAALFAPPQGGFDPNALLLQTVLPLSLGANAAVFHDQANRLHLGVAYSALMTWTHTQALGLGHDESGLGHEFSAELGYARSFGRLEIVVRARYGLRRTAVGLTTNTLEVPWYQTAGLSAGVGLGL